MTSDVLTDSQANWNKWQAIIYEFSIKLAVLLSSLSTKILKPFWVKFLQMRNDLPVTGLVSESSGYIESHELSDREK